jgi:[ribosomal protein S5]-alanine N-acetyltransferase
MIKGKKINLRVVREKDLPILFDRWSDIENRGEFFPISLSSEPKFYNEFKETGFWTDQSGRLLIVNKENDAILGMIFFFKSVPYFDALEIGYILFATDRRGQGLTTEALNLFVQFLFETKTIRRLHLTVFVGNTASKRVAEKCGFQSEGIARKAVFLKGRHMDIEWFSILREDIFLP